MPRIQLTGIGNPQTNVPVVGDLALASGNIVVGNGSGVAAAVTMSGNATIANTGAVTLDETLIRYATVTVAAANIPGVGAGTLGHADGVELVAAPAAGKALEFISAVVVYERSGDAYTDGGNVGVIYTGGFGAVSGVVSAANSIAAAGSKVVQLLAVVPPSNSMPLATSLALTSSAGFTNPAAAAGVLRVKVAYRIHTTGL